MFCNTLSRLWWLGRLTYDENRKDSFELTRYWEEDFSTKMLILFSSNYMGNENITRGLISALIELERQKISVSGRKRNLYYLASQYLAFNFMLNIVIPSCYSRLAVLYDTSLFP